MIHPTRILAVTVTILWSAVSFSALPWAADAAGSTSPPPYTNYTVGGSAGWVFNSTSNSSDTDYATWAASQQFFLGDFLIFNTDGNSTVVQTYNKTTYSLCSADDDNGNDTFVISAPGGGGGGDAVGVVAVPLTEVGPQYYFSDADNGVQCFQGMRFNISVAEGRGLPPALNQPPPPPHVDSGPPPPAPDAATATPGTGQGEAFYNGGPPAREGLSGGRVRFWGVLGVVLLLVGA